METADDERARVGRVDHGVDFEELRHIGGGVNEVVLTFPDSKASGLIWYAVTLPAGTPTISLTGAPADFSLDVDLEDPNQDLGYVATGSTLKTGAVTVSPSAPLAAGTYYVGVTPSFSIIDAYGPGSTPADYATQKYTLLVTP